MTSAIVRVARRLPATRRLLAPGLTAILVTAGLGAIAPARALAASTGGTCLPALDTTLGSGDFTASTNGSGAGNVGIDTGTVSYEGTGRLVWSARQTVTGNTGGPGGSMTGALNLSVSVNGHAVSFVSSCILEAGVFAGEMEEDPFGETDPEPTHTAIRGIEGEWIGTAYNLPAPGQSTPVVASLAVWTTDVGPRFHLDMVSATTHPTTCPSEHSVPSASAAGPTVTNPASNVVVSAPDMWAARGACA